MVDLDLRVPTPERLAAALLDAGPDSGAVLRAFAAAAKPPGTVAYAAAELLPVERNGERKDVRRGRHLADLVWAEEPEERSPWHLYRGLRLALVASGPPWLGIATLADLRAEHRLLSIDAELPELREIDAFWRGHRHRCSGEILLLATWDAKRGSVWSFDGDGPPRKMAERERSSRDVSVDR